MTGWVDVLVLFFIQVGSRRVHLAGMTANPDRAWMVQQPRNMAMVFDQEPVKPTYLLRDRDNKFVQEFDAILVMEGIEVKPLDVRAPNQNAVAERFVQSVRQECLDHFVVFGGAICDTFCPNISSITINSSASRLGQPAAGMERIAHGGLGSTLGRGRLPGAAGCFAATLPAPRGVNWLDEIERELRPRCASEDVFTADMLSRVMPASVRDGNIRLWGDKLSVPSAAECLENAQLLLRQHFHTERATRKPTRGVTRAFSDGPGDGAASAWLSHRRSPFRGRSYGDDGRTAERKPNGIPLH